MSHILFLIGGLLFGIIWIYRVEKVFLDLPVVRIEQDLIAMNSKLQINAKMGSDMDSLHWLWGSTQICESCLVLKTHLWNILPTLMEVKPWFLK